MPTPQKRTPLRALTVSAMLTALLCALSPIAIPLGAVPISLGLFGVMLISLLLPPANNLAAVATYLTVGLCGLPVFGGGHGGISALFGPTGGYLWGYLVSAPLISLIARRNTAHRFAVACLACLAALPPCYLLGTVQYLLLTRAELSAALWVCVLPFVPFDLLKAFLAALLGLRLSKINRLGLC